MFAVIRDTDLLILFILQKVSNIYSPSGSKTEKSNARSVLWFISVARNAIVVLICAFTAFIFEVNEMKPFSLTGKFSKDKARGIIFMYSLLFLDKVAAGLPTVAPPPFSAFANNQTYAFEDMVFKLGGGVVVVPLIAILGNVAIAKAFCE